MILRFQDNVKQICLIYWSTSLGFRYTGNYWIELFPDVFYFYRLHFSFFVLCIVSERQCKEPTGASGSHTFKCTISA